MKKLFYSCLIGVLCMMSCQKAPSYKIYGTVNDIPNGDTIMLQEFKNGEMYELESTVVKNGNFTFKGRQDSVVNRYITYIKGNKKYFVDFFLSNGDIDVVLGPVSKVSGTKDNDIYQEFKDSFIATNNAINNLYMKSKMDTTLSEIDKAALLRKIDIKDSLGMEMVYNTIYNNISNPVGIYLLPQFAEAFNLQKQKDLINKVPLKYQNNKSIIELKNNISKKEKVAIGEKYINFSMSTPEGNMVNLSNYVDANKFTLVDFWASWCGPCISEMPYVAQVYKKYKEKGLEIVGVSLDNNANNWKESIERLQMTWPQVSDLKGWDNKAAKLYGINAIPATILINQEGIIIAKNLRGDALEEKLNELFTNIDINTIP